MEYFNTTTFPTLEICVNVTKNCYSHGQCLLQNYEWSCSCALLYDPAVSCLQNFFYYYQGRDTFYYVLGWVCIFIGLVFLVPEIVMDIHLKRYKLLNFTAKILALGFMIFRSVDYGFWCYHSVTRYIYYPQSFIIFELAVICSVGCYIVIVLMWINLYTKVSNLTEKDSTYFHRATIGLTIYLFLFIISELALSILFVSGVEPTITETIYDAICCLSALLLMFWSWYHSFKMCKEFGSKNSGSLDLFLQKNNLLAIFNGVLLPYVATLIVYAFLNLRASVWGYLITMTILRVNEFIGLFLIILILRNYSFVGTNPFKQWKTTWTTQPSVP